MKCRLLQHFWRIYLEFLKLSQLCPNDVTVVFQINQALVPNSVGGSFVQEQQPGAKQAQQD